MLFDDLTIQLSGKALAKSFNGGKSEPRDLRKVAAPQSGRFVSVPRGAHPLPSRDAGDAFQGPIDTRVGSAKVTRLVAGHAQDSDYLTRKRGGAIGMMEGWREITEEPVRQRVGLLGMQY